jgi:hypothetical protein
MPTHSQPTPADEYLSSLTITSAIYLYSAAQTHPTEETLLPLLNNRQFTFLIPEKRLSLKLTSTFFVNLFFVVF